MKSRISSCNLTAFRKDITRFAPLWAIYFIVGMMVVLTMFGSSTFSNAGVLVQTLDFFAGINAVYAALCANLLFGDLFNAKLCNATHAMPLRRETWFASHVAAGLCFSLVPHLLASLFMMPYLGGLWYVSLLWAGVMALQYLFFFGVAVFSCMATGNRFAMVTVYGIINFFSMIVAWFCSAVYFPRLYGIDVQVESFELFCPVMQLVTGSNGAYLRLDYMKEEILGFGSGWGYLWILAGLGVAVLLVALLMYRHRALETAGDFISTKLLKPVFLVVFTLSVGAVFSVVGGLFSGYASYAIYLVIGLFIGFFTGRMLLMRTAKVFNLRSFLACGGLAAVLLLSVLAVSLDPFGIVRWVPKADEVDSVTVGYMGGFTTDDPTVIGQVIELHKLGLENRAESEAWSSIEITYKMKDGRKISRTYTYTAEQLQKNKLFGSVPALFGGRDEEQVRKDLYCIEADTSEGYITLTDKESRELIEAILKDIKDEKVVAPWSYSGGESKSLVVMLKGANNNLQAYSLGIMRVSRTGMWMEKYVKEMAQAQGNSLG